MTNTTSGVTTMRQALLRNGIGLDHLYHLADAPATSNFPPHNIEQTGEHSYRLTLAVAGYNRSDINVLLHRDLLTVRGAKGDDNEARPGYQLLYRGISFRDFERQFTLGEYVEVSNVALDNGMLIIDLQRSVPEACKPRLLDIN